MPNWCFNTLSVSGTKELVDELIAKVSTEDTKLSLGNILPIPEDEQTDWYNWCVTNWGTKWDVVADIEVWHNKDGSVEATWMFDSAWSPPVHAIEKMAQDHPELHVTLVYDEPGNDFAGEIAWEYGEVTHESEYPSPTAEAWADEDYLNEEPFEPIKNKCMRE